MTAEASKSVCRFPPRHVFGGRARRQAMEEGGTAQAGWQRPCPYYSQASRIASKPPGPTTWMAIPRSRGVVQSRVMVSWQRQSALGDQQGQHTPGRSRNQSPQHVQSTQRPQEQETDQDERSVGAKAVEDVLTPRWEQILGDLLPVQG